MSREHRIPERFLVAEREAVEDALRRGIRAALLSHMQAGNFFASWEDGHVVLVPPLTIPFLEPCSNRELFEDREAFKQTYERTSLLQNVKHVYVKDDTFYVIYTNERRYPFLHRSPDSLAPELRDICYELTGRDLDIRVLKEGAPEGENLLLELLRPSFPTGWMPKDEAARRGVVEDPRPASDPGSSARDDSGVRVGDAPPGRES